MVRFYHYRHSWDDDNVVNPAALANRKMESFKDTGPWMAFTAGCWECNKLFLAKRIPRSVPSVCNDLQFKMVRKMRANVAEPFCDQVMLRWHR